MTTTDDVEIGCTQGEANCKNYASLLEDYQVLLGNLHSVLPHLSLLSGATQQSQLPTLNTPSTYFSPASLTAILANLS
jgi:hypothetical protein